MAPHEASGRPGASGHACALRGSRDPPHPPLPTSPCAGVTEGRRPFNQLPHEERHGSELRPLLTEGRTGLALRPAEHDKGVRRQPRTQPLRARKVQRQHATTAAAAAAAAAAATIAAAAAATGWCGVGSDLG